VFVFVLGGGPWNTSNPCGSNNGNHIIYSLLLQISSLFSLAEARIITGLGDHFQIRILTEINCGYCVHTEEKKIQFIMQ
jgi:hypothetical protein